MGRATTTEGGEATGRKLGHVIDSDTAHERYCMLLRSLDPALMFETGSVLNRSLFVKPSSSGLGSCRLVLRNVQRSFFEYSVQASMRPRVTWPPGDSMFLTRGAEGTRVGDRSGRREGEVRLHVLTRGSLEVKGRRGRGIRAAERQGRDVVEEAGGQVLN